jgi:hypothetical protein
MALLTSSSERLASDNNSEDFERKEDVHNGYYKQTESV